ncbi:MAG: MarR family transcriptional regulator [Bacteroidetes bacterium]|jgi:DNA-binding MarR family transcriptional regulator|nr:MarR family transcriptional regulator [Bacteroidota bacterium]
MEEGKTEQSVGFQFGEFMRVFRKVVVKRFQERETDITLEQFGILVKLMEDGMQTQTDIAGAVGMDKSAVLRIVDVLEEKKYVERVNDSEDRRKKTLALTKRGKAKIEDAGKLFSTVIEDISAGVKESDMKSFMKTLGRMKENAEQL